MFRYPIATLITKINRSNKSSYLFTAQSSLMEQTGDFMFRSSHILTLSSSLALTMVSLGANATLDTDLVWPWNTLTLWIGGALKSHSRNVSSWEQVTTSFSLWWVHKWVSSWSWPATWENNCQKVHGSSVIQIPLIWTSRLSKHQKWLFYYNT